MLKKNDELIGTVVSTASNGEGIVKHDGIVVFVPFSIIGEKIKYKILKVTSKCVFGKLLEVLQPSPYRVKPSCPVFTKCGGCQLQHLDYKYQLDIKRESVKNCFTKIANIDANVLDTLPCDNLLGYRNKLQLPVEQVGDKTLIGFYAENSHRVVAIDDCDINPDWTSKIISAFKQYILEFNIKGYDNTQNKGDLREITVKSINGSLIITAVVLHKNIKGLDRLIEILKSYLTNEFSLFINVNNSTSNVIYGKEFSLIYGNPFYLKEMLGIKCKVGVQSFMQVNDEMCEKLYSYVVSNVDSDKNSTVIDAYSGAGLMTALLSKNAKKTIGIEIIKEAVECANELVKLNNLESKVFNHVGKCEELLPDIISKEAENGNQVNLVLDPPRKGCDYKVIQAILRAKPKKIVYVSCMPSTLARDVGLITGSLTYKDNQIVKSLDTTLNYRVESVKPFDLFPNTRHVESVAILTRI